MATLSEIDIYLKELLQPQLFDDYGPNGIQVEGKKIVKKAACAVSASLNVLKEAAKQNVDFLFTHHGLFWNKDPYPITGSKKDKIKTLLDHEMTLCSYHLPLDSHTQYGNNFKAAQDMGWQNLSRFSLVGVKGTFAPISRDAFTKKLETYYNHIAYTAFGGPEVITSAALTSGGAHRELFTAAKAGVDCFISGSFDEPIWHGAFEEKINFYALGHSATEEIGPKAIMGLLEEEFDLEVVFIKENNPF